MTQPIQLIDQVFAVEMPEGAENICVSQLIGTPKVFADLPGYLWAAKLPAGNWESICTSKKATYTQAAQLVEHSGGGWKDYDKDNFHHDLPFMSPFDSLRSLLTSKGLDPVNKNYIILKKVS